MVATKKVRTLTVFLIDILYSHKLDKMESAIIKVVPFSQVCCLFVILGSNKSLVVVTSSSFFVNNFLRLDCKDFKLSIKTIN